MGWGRGTQNPTQKLAKKIKIGNKYNIEYEKIWNGRRVKNNCIIDQIWYLRCHNLFYYCQQSIMGKPPIGISIMGQSNNCNLGDKNNVLPRCPLHYPFTAPLLLRCYPRQLQTRPNFSFPYIIVMRLFLPRVLKL